MTLETLKRKAHKMAAANGHAMRLETLHPKGAWGTCDRCGGYLSINMQPPAGREVIAGSIANKRCEQRED